MEITALCAVLGVLRVLPSKSQFFQYESVSLSCERNWTIKRYASKNISEDCSSDEISEPDCSIDDLYPSDSGFYWCESAAGECSETINITVTGGLVILESPVHPVVEGDNVTLGCRQKTTSSSNFTAQFYRDGLLIGSSSTGTLTISSVSTDHQGLYKCSVSGAGQSPDAWLVVKAADKRKTEPHSSVVHLVLPVVVVGLFLVAVMLLCLWRRHKGKKVDPAVSYTDITIIEGGRAKMTRGRSFAQTFYSKVKPESTRQEAAAKPSRQNKRS
ncbi:uncharacterized protein V6R79_026052 [Siganus canaliculatus]